MIVTTPGTTFRTGHEAQIRRSMLAAGVLDAVIQLPARLRPNTSLPPVVWILRPPTKPHDVLMIDASSLGTAGRSTSTLDDGPIQRIVEIVRKHEQGEVSDDELAWVVTTDDLLANDAIVEPLRYRPSSVTNFDEIRQRALELRNLLPTAVIAANVALDRLIAKHGTGGRP